MNVHIRKSKTGSALVVVLTTVAIVAIAMTSYLALVSNQNKTVARSAAWNQCIPVCEGGIEEALTQLHYCFTNNLTTNSWTLGADGLYHKTRSFTDGSYYSVSILATNPPVIYSTGFVAVPYSPANYLIRRVRVNTIAPELGGIYAKGAISMVGNAYVDSYDSSNPNYCSNGQYVASLHQANATVLTDSDAAGAISAKTILGTAVTGPTGTVTGGPIGDTNYTGSGIESGHDENDANVQFNDNSAPFAFNTGITPISGSYTNNGTNYQYVLGSGDYSMTSLSSPTMLITGKPTILYVSGSLDLTGGFIYINPGASLQIYLGGSVNMAGGGIVNGNGVATNLYVYGLPTCTSMQFSGNAEFVGVVNAPEADVSYKGNADFCGSLIANTVSMVGKGNFHCDTGIIAQGVTVASWNEF